MQRSVAVLLACTFSWMFLLPLLAASALNNLPACCRRNGKHHCLMAGETAQAASAFAALGGNCPYVPRCTSALQEHSFKPAAKQAIFAGIVSHPSGSPQTEAGYRASHYRSKQKRGPPSLIVS